MQQLKTNVDIETIEINCEIDAVSLKRIKKCYIKLKRLKNDTKIVANAIEIFVDAPSTTASGIKNNGRIFKSTIENKYGDKEEINIDDSNALPRRSKRIRREVDDKMPIIEKKPAIVRKNNQIITPTQMSNIIWAELTSKNVEICVGMLVCAKMRTFWPWPAIVLNIKGKKVRVKFFGDLREGSINKYQCVPFAECHHLVFGYVTNIQKEQRCEWYKNAFPMLNRDVKLTKGFPQKKLYLQSLKDVEAFTGFSFPILLLP